MYSLYNSLYSSLKACGAARVGKQEKDAMLRYVDDEVQRVKDMFRDKEQKLTAERQAAETKGEAAEAEVALLRPRVVLLESQLASLPQELEVLH